jgi:RNA polymerase sigma factor (sigma-70 family)
MTDDLLIKACLAKNAQAYEELYQRFSPKMLVLCYRYAKTREDAEDMLQEGFVKVFTCLGQFKFLGSFEGWIRKIMVHSCINNLKRNKKFTDTLEISSANYLSMQPDYIPSLIQAKQVIACIRSLPFGYRMVLNLYALEGFSHAEIGEMLDIKESSSRSQYVRAKALLKTILEKNNIVMCDKNEDDFLNTLLQAN